MKARHQWHKLPGVTYVRQTTKRTTPTIDNKRTSDTNKSNNETYQLQKKDDNDNKQTEKQTNKQTTVMTLTKQTLL